MRTHQRLDLDVPLYFEVLSIDPAGEELNREGSCRNLSLTGIYFETKRDTEILARFKVGNIMWVKFNIPETEESIKVQCEIRRVLVVSKRVVGFGAMFINLPKNAERLIVQFVK